jgi:5-methylcytosine-specific restriction protein A
VHARAQARAKEHRRPNADVRHWYHLARWRHPVWGRRAQVLARDPLCVQCKARGRIVPTTDVDHIVPHDGDPVRFWDPANLQGLCHACHSEKTGTEKRQGGVRHD